MRMMLILTDPLSGELAKTVAFHEECLDILRLSAYQLIAPSSSYLGKNLRL